MSTGIGTRLARLEQPALRIVPEEAIPLRTPTDVVALVATTVNDLRTGRLDARTAAVIGRLADVALRALEISEVADRLEALESILEPERRRLSPRRR